MVKSCEVANNLLRITMRESSSMKNTSIIFIIYLEVECSFYTTILYLSNQKEIKNKK